MPHSKSNRSTNSPAIILGLIVLAIAGCDPRLSVTKEITLEPLEIKTVLVDPIGSDQTIKVTAKASELFHLHVCLSDDESAVDEAVERNKDPEKALAGALSKKEHSVSATIPAGKTAVVRLQAADGKTTVATLKIEN